MNVSQAIVKIIESLGVDTVFGGLGEQNSYFPIAFKNSEKIKTVIVKHEQAASFMATGYAMFSGKLGVCFATAGPGEFNLFSGAAVALSDSLPVLFISGYVHKALEGTGVLNEASGVNRTPNAQAMWAATTKKTFMLEKPNDVFNILEEAINLAFDGRPGPVNIHIPEDVFVAEVGEFQPINFKINEVAPEPAMVEKYAKIITDAIAKGEKIMAIVGYGTICSGAEKATQAFLEKYQIPFSVTIDAKGIINEDNPLFLGAIGTTGSISAKNYFKESTTILAIGNSFAQNATFLGVTTMFDNKTLLHINIDPKEIGKIFKTDFGMVSDVKLAIHELDKALTKNNFVAKKAEVIKELNSLQPIAEVSFVNPPIKSDRIQPALLAREIGRLLPENSFIFGEAGCSMMWLQNNLYLTKNQLYQNPGSFGPMASIANAAIGVKAAHPDKPVIVGTGDSCYLMAGFELLTALQNDLPVIWIIFNNNEFNAIRYYQTFMHQDDAGTRYQNPDYVMYANACGAKGYLVTKIEQFEAAFKEALASNKPALIDVHINGEVFPPYDMAF